MNKTNKKITGFTETLQKITNKPNMNPSVCVPIYMNGMNSNKINFFQSEFPNLTKIKPLIRLNQNQNQNQNSVKIDKKVKNKSEKKVKNKSEKKVNFAIPNKTNTKKKKFSFAMPSKTNSKTKTKKVNFAV
jgi:hypothetical protein